MGRALSSLAGCLPPSGLAAEGSGDSLTAAERGPGGRTLVETEVRQQSHQRITGQSVELAGADHAFASTCRVTIKCTFEE